MNRILVLRSMILAVSMAAANLTADGTWTVQPSGTAANLDEVQFVDPGTGWIWGRSGVLLATTDGGETWENQPGGDIGSFGGLDFIDGRTGRAFRTITTESDPDHYWICSVFKTTDGGMNWDFLCDNADYSFRDMQFAGPDTGFAIAEQFVHKFFVLRTTDGGVTWLPSFSQDFHETGPRNLFVINSRRAWAAYKEGDGEGQWINFIATTDGGDTWDEQGSYWLCDGDCQFTVGNIYSLFFLDPVHGWACVSGWLSCPDSDPTADFFQIQTSAIGGWACPDHPSPWLTDIHFTNQQAGWGIQDGEKIVRSTNGGEDWTVHRSQAGEGYRDLTFINDKHGWAVGDNGLILKYLDPSISNPPVARLNPVNYYIRPGGMLVMDGSGSYDKDGDPMTYAWSCLQKPEGSAFTVTDGIRAVFQNILTDRGYYRFQFTVTTMDGSSILEAYVFCGIRFHFTAGDDILSSPAVGPDSTIYFGSKDDKLYAVRPDGTLKWSYMTGGDVLSSPAVCNSPLIVFGSGDNKLHAVDGGGNPIWSYETLGPVRSSPAVSLDGTIYVGSDDKYLHAVTSDGQFKWKFETGGAVESSAAIGPDRTIYMGSNDGILYAVNPDGTLKWSFDTGSPVRSSPVVTADNAVYAGSDNGRLCCIRKDGTEKWRFETGAAVSSSPAVGPDGVIYVGSADKKLYALNSDGSQKWAFLTGGSVLSSPAVDADGTVYFGSLDDKIYALNPDGTLKFFYLSGGDIQSSPVIGPDSTVYVGCNNGRLYPVHASCNASADSDWPCFRHDAGHTGRVQEILHTDFSADTTNGTGTLEVQFTDLSAGTVTSWLWDFGDGGTSTEQNPVHVYTFTDTFSVILTVTGPSGSDSKTSVNLILVQPVVNAAAKSGLPEAFALFPAYPNPFNRKTQFRFSLPVESRVLIEISDMRGNRVKRLDLKRKPAGYHTAGWDPGDAPSGIYMIRILAGSFTQVRKCVLIK